MRQEGKRTAGMRLAGLLLGTALLFGCAASVSGADLSYSGLLDPYTNEEYTNASEADSGIIDLTDSMQYDFDARMFVYPVGSAGNVVRASVPDGMVTRSQVVISAGGAADIIAVFRDGSEYTGDLGNIREIGEYVVTSRSGSDSSRLFSFRIVGESTNALQVFTAPEDFYVSGAERDGQAINTERYTCRMDAEGFYRITCESLTADLVYTLETYVDRTPPELTFSGKINDNNQVRSALTVSGVEEGGRITVSLDGTQINPEFDSEGKTVLRNSGDYVINAYDAAGNLTTYNFTIMMYFNIGSIAFIMLVAVLLIGVSIYILIRKRNLKIG